MRLLQFSTSHYCRKARLILGYKQIEYQVENLTPGLHLLKLKPLTGLTTLPVLLPQQPDEPQAIADSTRIWQYLEQHYPQPPLVLANFEDQRTAEVLEDWLDESIGTATRFVYYDYRAGEGKSINPSLSSQLIIQWVRRQYGMSAPAVEQASLRLSLAMAEIGSRWQYRPYLVGDRISIADITAAALLSPLALVPEYRQNYPWLFERIQEIHIQCREPLPPGLIAPTQTSAR
ncbi:MAG: glutathione S-transferase family protein [Desertifilum sp.]|nr:glutathione S-transferase family protein [Desertifilum sp.]